MNQLIQRHKIKLLLIFPFVILFLLILGAFYILSLTGSSNTTQLTPANIVALHAFDNLDIKAKAFVVYDSRLKRIIYSRNPQSQLPLASLTKIMSAAVALDLSNKDTLINVSTNNNFNPNDRYALIPGVWKLGDLLRLTLVASSNSGISLIANQLSPDFLNLMNKKAKTLGLNQSYFLNESGLDINSSLAGGYGSAKDVAVLFDNALQTNPDIFGATKYDSVVINSADGHSESVLNTNTDLSQIKGVVASKTGFTDLAQGNLAIAFDINSQTRVFIVVLGSTQDGRFSDVEELSRATLAYYSLI